MKVLRKIPVVSYKRKQLLENELYNYRLLLGLSRQ
jgi:hypothetical protein